MSNQHTLKPDERVNDARSAVTESESSVAASDSDMPGFYVRWRERTHHWLRKQTRDEIADAALFLPDLLALIIRLMRDPRTPLFYKSQLLLVAFYILSPVDFIPEAVFGAMGLADDALIASIMVMKLVQHASTIDPQVLRDNWSGSGDVIERLNEIIEGGGELASTQVWKRVRGIFGKPDPATVESRPPESRLSESGNWEG